MKHYLCNRFLILNEQFNCISFSTNTSVVYFCIQKKEKKKRDMKIFLKERFKEKSIDLYSSSYFIISIDSIK